MKKPAEAARLGVEVFHDMAAGLAGADAVLCASIFYYGRYTVGEARAYLAAAGIPVREHIAGEMNA